MRSRAKKTPRRVQKGAPACAPRKCRRDGCNCTEIVSFGLCQACYDILKGTRPKKRRTNDRHGERDPVAREHKFRVGDIGLISQNYRDRRVQGLYCQVVSVDDEGAVLVVELTGDCSSPIVSKAVRAMAGEVLRICSHWVLACEE